MARYIDADDLKVVIHANDWSNPVVPDVVGVIIDRSPTANVVPRAEIEEIFSEIYKEIESALNSNYKARRERINGCGARDMFLNVVDGKIAALRGLHEFIEYLEEKHTGGE